MTRAKKKWWMDRIEECMKLEWYLRAKHFAILCEEAEQRYPILSDDRYYALSMITTAHKRDMANRFGMKNPDATKPMYRRYGWQLKEVTA